MNWSFYTLAALAASTAHGAWADPRLDEKVYDPFVERHSFELETRWGREFGPGVLTASSVFVAEAEAGFTDNFSLAAVGQFDHAPGHGNRLAAAGLEGVADLGRLPGLGVEAGVYLEFEKGLGDREDKGEAKLLLARSAGRFQGLLNLIAERPFGAATGQGLATYGYAASATWRVLGNLRAGAEAYGDLGDDHGLLRRRAGAYVGPVLNWEGRLPDSPVSVELGAGWLAPIGAARVEARSQGRINVSFERQF